MILIDATNEVDLKVWSGRRPSMESVLRFSYHYCCCCQHYTTSILLTFDIGHSFLAY
jgi:hypothetical protein